MTRSQPQLSVIVCTGPHEELLPFPEGKGVEWIVVAEGGRGESRRGDRSLNVFPAGPGYARNRGLAVATGPTVAFLDGAARVGPDWLDAALDARGERVVVAADGATAFPRDRLVSIGGFDLSLGRVPGRAYEADAVLRLAAAGTEVRVDRRLGLPRRTGLRQAFASGLGLGRVARRHRDPSFAARNLRAVSPREALGRTAGVVVGGLRRPARDAPRLDGELVPDALRADLEKRTLAPLALRRKAKTQYLYRAGEDALLHVYVDPSARLGRSLAEREAIRTRSTAGGIPRVLASAEGLDSLWVLEELLPGSAPDAREVEGWLPRVTGWAVALALPAGPPLRESEPWREHRAELVGEAPADLRGTVERAARVVEKLPSVHMHGDLQRANVLLSPGGVGAVDWEGAWLHGIPGLDLVFLALLAGDTPPDAKTVRDVAAGRRLRPELERVGIRRDLVHDALLVHLASWSASERRRLVRLGAPPREPLFRPLLDELGPELARQASPATRRTTAGDRR